MTRHRVVATLMILLASLALGALTRQPLVLGEAQPTLRLSWRVRGEEEERCHRATEAELANVPAHMRQQVICEERRVAPYRLRAWVDERLVLDERAPGSGVAGDRPMYLLRDIALTAGQRRIAVRLERTSTDAEKREEASDTTGQRERGRRGIPPVLAMDTTVVARGGEILLVTYSPDMRQLVVLTPAAGGL